MLPERRDPALPCPQSTPWQLQKEQRDMRLVVFPDLGKAEPVQAPRRLHSPFILQGAQAWLIEAGGRGV